ncbi:hypothetical protein NPIL_499571 [Nephila pilipes]|uniref:Uncharacterized protein n=1 Tax=Nephila pilipes TaxID=299642 RepID=A0A8X6N6N6_NEPPI|nr:hypothetical protein NPIL_579341 [Nephila pilipes]GFT11463.1 hypothetical protein NPIL_499571 [Nephila pilipes]
MVNYEVTVNSLSYREKAGGAWRIAETRSWHASTSKLGKGSASRVAECDVYRRYSGSFACRILDDFPSVTLLNEKIKIGCN